MGYGLKNIPDTKKNNGILKEKSQKAGCEVWNQTTPIKANPFKSSIYSIRFVAMIIFFA
jgi:hypothetical protein